MDKKDKKEVTLTESRKLDRELDGACAILETTKIAFDNLDHETIKAIALELRGSKEALVKASDEKARIKANRACKKALSEQVQTIAADLQDAMEDVASYSIGYSVSKAVTHSSKLDKGTLTVSCSAFQPDTPEILRKRQALAEKQNRVEGILKDLSRVKTRQVVKMLSSFRKFELGESPGMSLLGLKKESDGSYSGDLVRKFGIQINMKFQPSVTKEDRIDID